MASNTLDPCAGCDNPCSNYSEILKQIDQGSMIGSVEKHRRHLCIAQPIPPAQWPKDVKDLAGNYIAEIGRVLKKQKDAIGYAVKLTSASVVTTTTSADSLRAADWYLFPDQIQIRDVQFEQIEGIIQRLFVDDQSNIQIREKTRSIEEQLKGNVHLPMLGETIQCERLNGLWLLVCCHYKRDERCGKQRECVLFSPFNCLSGVLGPMLIDTIEKYARESHRTNDVHCLKISHIGEGRILSRSL